MPRFNRQFKLPRLWAVLGCAYLLVCFGVATCSAQWTRVEIDDTSFEAGLTGSVMADSSLCNATYHANYCSIGSGVVMDACEERALRTTAIDLRARRSFLVASPRVAFHVISNVTLVWPSCHDGSSDTAYRLFLKHTANHDGATRTTGFMTPDQELEDIELEYHLGDLNAAFRDAEYMTLLQTRDLAHATIMTLALTQSSLPMPYDSTPLIRRWQRWIDIRSDLEMSPTYSALVSQALPGFTAYYVNAFDQGVDQHVISWSHSGSESGPSYVQAQASDPADCRDRCIGVWHRWSESQHDSYQAEFRFTDLPVHKEVQISMDLLLMTVLGDWLGEENGDSVLVIVDGVTRMEASLATAAGVPMCYPLDAGCAKGNHVTMAEQTGWTDRRSSDNPSCSVVYDSQLAHVRVPVTLVVPHTSTDALTVVVRPKLAGDGGLAIDNVMIATGETPSLLWLWLTLTGVLVAAVAGAAIWHKSSSNTASASSTATLELPTRTAVESLATAPAPASKSTTQHAAAPRHTASDGAGERRASAKTARRGTGSVSRTRSGSGRRGRPRRTHSGQMRLQQSEPTVFDDDLVSVRSGVTTASAITAYGSGDDYGSTPSSS